MDKSIESHSGPAADRAKILDIIRGIALLGILVMNISFLSGYVFMDEAQKAALSTFASDNIIYQLELLLFQGKFYSIFSFLFGLGCSIFINNASKKGVNPVRLFHWRMAVLILIGIIHIRFLWEGDILLLYALIGFLLPLFSNLSDRRLLILSVIFLLAPIALDLSLHLIGIWPAEFLFELGWKIDQTNGFTEDTDFSTYLYRPELTFSEFIQWQESAFLYRWGDLIQTHRPFKVLGMFLIGYVAGRNQIYLELEKHKPLFKKIAVWGAVSGILLGLAYLYFYNDKLKIQDNILGIYDSIFHNLQVVPLALSYMSCFALLYMQRKNKRWLEFFAPVGRMALSSYLSQSILCILIFYGFGLGWGGRVGPTILIFTALGIFIFQTIVSYYWLQYFRFGPVEWFWRTLTYRKWQAFRK
ncbi:MAG: DUF418 domain-containing protein [Saprospiraceae bacterium]|nr:DUF418 domain-containing protein [Saprospiraceae bacterium]